jgi:hypothetical protein
MNRHTDCTTALLLAWNLFRLHAPERLPLIWEVGLTHAKRHFGFVPGAHGSTDPRTLASLLVVWQLANEVIEDVQKVKEHPAEKLSIKSRYADKEFKVLVRRHKPTPAQVRTVLANKQRQLAHTLRGVSFGPRPRFFVDEVGAMRVLAVSRTQEEVIERPEVQQERVDESDPPMVVMPRLVDGVHHLGQVAEMMPDLPDDRPLWLWRQQVFQCV